MSTSPQILDKYELRNRLGGSDGIEVWKAFDTQQQRSVVVNILHANLQNDPDFPTRFFRKAGRLASLLHPNIAQVRDFRISHSPTVANTDGTTAYVVMDYIEGQTLADYIHSTSQQGKFPLASEIVHLLTPISLAIDYGHQQDVIHGHLKPTNILLDKSNTSLNPMGQPILTDFGTTQMLRTSSGPSQDISSYTAPEQAQGYAGNERSDLYALGVILYELFTGVLPFQGDNPADTKMKLIHDTPTSPALINPHIPPALTVILLRSLAKDPAARFPNATAMLVAIAKALNIPVPENLNVASTPADARDMPTYFSGGMPSSGQAHEPADARNMPTYFSPLPANRLPGTTPSSPVVGTSTTPSTAYPQALPLQSDTAQSSPQTPLLTPTAGYSQASPLHASLQPQPVPTPRKKSRRGLYIGLIVLLLLAVVGSGLVVLLGNPFLGTTTPIAGHAFFASSGLLSLNSNQGITDQLQLNLQNISNPDPGKSYYAWLLSDKGADPATTPPIFLGRLQVSHGTVSLSYPGTPDHADLLTSYSRFLITQEDASVTPSNPSLDTSTLRYYAEFSAVPNPKDTAKHYSLLNHLRHLLSEDPTLKTAGLTGGLDIWFFRNSEKILEWSGSARDSNNPAFIHRQVTRILDYLDGEAYVGKEVPPGTALLVDPIIARIPLLASVQGQTPPPYVVHIGNHLREITQAPNVTPAQIALAIEINQAVNNVKARLEQVHKDALLLINMTDAELSQPLALSTLNDMTTQANDAFAGQIDPSTNQVVPGIAKIHYDIQRLATFDITLCVVNGSNSCTL